VQGARPHSLDQPSDAPFPRLGFQQSPAAERRVGQAGRLQIEAAALGQRLFALAQQGGELGSVLRQQLAGRHVDPVG
jgi:hypothetical protein